MPRGAGRRAGSGRSHSPPPAGSRPYASTPKRHYVAPRSPSAAPARPGWFKGGNSGMGIGGAIAGSFLGSALGTVLGNAISRRMYEGRDPDTGDWTDPGKEDKNPCKRELDYFLLCARYSDDLVYCKGASEALKDCAERNKGYFEEV